MELYPGGIFVTIDDMRNYTDDWGDDVPGKGNVAYDKRHDDVVIHGFMTPKVERQKQKERLEDLLGARESINREIKEIKKSLNTTRHEKTTQKKSRQGKILAK